MKTKLSPQELAKIANVTLEHYNQRAEDFWRGTRDHDVSQNIAALLQYIEGHPPFTILDFGCGPGRDLKAFDELGHVAVGLEGAAEFAAMARAYSGCEVATWTSETMNGSESRPVISQPAAAFCIQVPIFETTVASQSTVKVG